MGQTVLAVSPRLFANSRQRTLKPILCAPLRPALQHPALSYATEEVSIHEALDLSFRRDVAVSRLDRELIDNLSRIKQASGF